MKCFVNYQRDDDAAVSRAQSLIDEFAREIGPDNVVALPAPIFDKFEASNDMDDFNALYVVIGPKRLAAFDYSHEPFDYVQFNIPDDLNRGFQVLPIVLETEDTRSLDELFALATNPEKYGFLGPGSVAIETLQTIGTREVLTRALVLARTDDPFKRARGVEILGDLGQSNHAFAAECLDAIVHVTETETDSEVLTYAAYALNNFSGGVAALARLAAHANAEARAAVGQSLQFKDDLNPEFVPILVGLANDPISDVSYQAMFALELAAPKGSEQAREALVSYLDHHDVQLRQQAICGLARCRDPRVVAPLIKELRACPESNDLNAAASDFLGLPEDAEKPGVEELIGQLERVG
jgi:hypothetical protein